MNSNALLIRAFKTFVQAFAASLALNINNVQNISAGKAVVIGAIAAGISGLMNLIIQPVEAK